MEHHLAVQKAERHGWKAIGITILGGKVFTLIVHRHRRCEYRIAVSPTSGLMYPLPWVVYHD